MTAVRRSRKHATDAAPRHVKIGDFLLIQVTSGPVGNETHRIKYAMRLARHPYVAPQEALKLFGRPWRFIIPGDNFRILRHPFDIEDVQVSEANYGQGVVRFAYLDPRDESEILRRDLLAGA